MEFLAFTRQRRAPEEKHTGLIAALYTKFERGVPLLERREAAPPHLSHEWLPGALSRTLYFPHGCYDVAIGGIERLRCKLRRDGRVLRPYLRGCHPERLGVPIRDAHLPRVQAGHKQRHVYCGWTVIR